MLISPKKNIEQLRNTLKVSLFSLLSAIIPLNLYAADENSIPPLPRVENAQVFAEFIDRYPAVLNYFTAESEANIIAFYQKNYGEIISRSLKRERLTIFFTEDDKSIRVVISQQNNKRQVDLLIELLPKESGDVLE